MSATPPERNDRDHAGAAPELTVTAARGAERTGRNIWILIISMALAVVLLLGYWLLHAPHLATINHPQARDMNAQDIGTFNTPAGSARQAPPGEPSTEQNTQ